MTDSIPYAKPLPMCWNCGIRRASTGKFCLECARTGTANAFATCRQPGCNTVKKASVPGQKWFWCKEHKQEGLL